GDARLGGGRVVSRVDDRYDVARLPAARGRLSTGAERVDDAPEEGGGGVHVLVLPVPCEHRPAGPDLRPGHPAEAVVDPGAWSLGPLQADLHERAAAERGSERSSLAVCAR